MKTIKLLKKEFVILPILYFIISINTAFSQDNAVNKQNVYVPGKWDSSRLISGQLDSLKGAKVVNIEFRYNNSRVGEMSELDYINKKVTEQNTQRAGKGDEWLVDWNERKIISETKMINSLNKYIKKADLTFQKDNKSAKYTLIANTDSMEPGWDIFMTGTPSTVNFNLVFMETQNNKEFAAMSCWGIGKGGVLPSAFEFAGRFLGDIIYKNMYPKVKAKK